MTDFTSQSGNFISAFSGAVDPRTGIYGYNFSIAQLTGNGGLGPSMPITLSYSPLTGTNTGFGSGVTLPTSSYDKSTRTLLLSTGEHYKVYEANNILNIIHAKPINFRVEIRDDGYYIFYKNGITERLTAPKKSASLKVTEEIFSPANRKLMLKWEIYGNGKRLTSVSDESSTLLVVKYAPAGVTFTVWPDTIEENTLKLRCFNDFLVSVTNNLVSVTDNKDSSALIWTLEYTKKLLTFVTGPTGLKEQVNYSATGHKFPTGGPTETVPYVTSYKQTGMHGQLIHHLTYEYSDKNFLGYGGSNRYSWDKNSDYLYGILGDYEYTSIETTHDKQGNSLSKIVRTYSNYHLQTMEESSLVGTSCKVVTKTEYYASKGKIFDEQPAQFQFPRQQTRTLTDSSKPEGKQRREEITFTEFNEHGNLIRQESPDGSVTEFEYYPAEGDGENCPPEPNGFIRFLKKKTLIPRMTEYNDSHPEITEYTYSQLADTGCVVQNSRKLRSGNTLLTEQRIEYNSDSSSTEFGRVITLTDTKYDGVNSFTTRQSFDTYVSDGLIVQNVTFTGHDGLTATHSRTFSAFSGQLFSETDAMGVTVNHEYDLLGRIVSQTVTPDTKYKRTVRWDYTIGDDGPVTIQTDEAGNQLSILFDSAGREIGRQQFDSDITKKFYDISSQSFDSLGRVSTISSRDWLPDTGKSTSFSLHTEVTNDEWGGVLVQNFSDNTRYFHETDPVALQQKNYMQGKAVNATRRTGTVTTSFDQRSYLALTDTLMDTSDTPQGTRFYGWDGWGQLRRETDERGNVTERTYDAFGRVLTQALADGSVVTRIYSPHLTGEQVASISVTGPDADGNTQDWLLGTQNFDSLGRLTKQSSGGRTTTYFYEGASPVPSLMTLPSGKKLQYTYIPELGNLISSVTAGDVTQTFSYDMHTGRLLQELEGEIGNEYLWNDSGTLATETFRRGTHQNVASHTHTLAGAAATYQDITGGQLVYSRDQYGRVTGLHDDGLVASFEYNELGRMSKQTVQNEGGNDSFITELEYDDFGREIKQTVTDSAGTSLITTSFWTKNGLLECKSLTGNNYAEDVQRNEMYEYDVRNRLVRYSVTGMPPVPDAYGNPLSEVIYKYDALNNLTMVISTLADGSSDTMTYEYKNSNDPTQLTSVTHSHDSYPQNILLEYDADGRMIKDEAGRELSYDGLGRLSSVAGGNLTEGRYHYDAGNRLSFQDTGSNGMRQLYYRGNELVVEVASS